MPNAFFVSGSCVAGCAAPCWVACPVADAIGAMSVTLSANARAMNVVMCRRREVVKLSTVSFLRLGSGHEPRFGGRTYNGVAHVGQQAPHRPWRQIRNPSLR